jgi:hypothetical protein
VKTLHLIIKYQLRLLQGHRKESKLHDAEIHLGILNLDDESGAEYNVFPYISAQYVLKNKWFDFLVESHAGFS